MGYQITYKYHKELSRGEYDKENSEIATVEVGNPFDDVPTEVLAGKVMALLARRNILVYDIEINELAKKQVNFKEAPDGIIIKNKKFRFDDGPIASGGVEVVEIQQTQPGVTLISQKGTRPTPAMISNKKPIRHEIYNPDNPIWEEQARKAYPDVRFTVGKKYPIFSEKAKNQDEPLAGMVYQTIDDTNKTRYVSDKLFIPPVVVADAEIFNNSGKPQELELNWGNEVDEAIPEIRDIRRR